MPPAPVRFSTTTDPCTCSCSFSARMRAAVSTAPPAAMGATSVIVRAGYACACAGRAAPVPETAVAAPSSTRKLRRLMYFPYREDRTNIALQGGLVVLRQKTRRLFLLNLLTQYGHLGSILAIATIKR